MVEYSRDRLSQLLAAVADPTRRAIVQRLARGPATVSQIAKPFPVSFNAVSKHVMVLERAGLVEREARGRERICRLRPRELHRASAWLDQYRWFWEERLDLLEDYVAVKAKERKQLNAKSK